MSEKANFNDWRFIMKKKTKTRKHANVIPYEVLKKKEVGDELEGHILYEKDNGYVISFGNFKGICFTKDMRLEDAEFSRVNKDKMYCFKFTITKITPSNLIVSRKKSIEKLKKMALQ